MQPSSEFWHSSKEVPAKSRRCQNLLLGTSPVVGFVLVRQRTDAYTKQDQNSLPGKLSITI
ncbi:hypothetical protein BK005_01980 [bacterium CG10_37_50]|nr:MAG: hypothetical protein BK005_01980 [bacterium CG10_37_50]